MVEEERARRQQDADDVARRELPDPVVPGHLEVIDGTGAELDRQRDRPLLGELIAVKPENQASVLWSVVLVLPPAGQP